MLRLILNLKMYYLSLKLRNSIENINKNVILIKLHIFVLLHN